MSRHAPLAVTALAVLTLMAPAAHAAPCPANSVAMGGAPTSSSAATVFDTTCAQGEGRWDMAAGRVFMRQNGSLGGVTVDSFDDFGVTGVAPGTIVNVLARLSVDGAIWTASCGSSGCYGRYVATLRHGDDSLEVFRYAHLYSGRVDYHDEIQILVPITAGQTERIEVRVFGRRDPGGSHLSEARCVLSFTVQDEGVGLTSCKGFAGSIVPVRANTWGRLKTIYE